MQRSAQRLQTLWYGFDHSASYLRLDLPRLEGAAATAWEVQFDFPGHRVTLSIRVDAKGIAQAFCNGERAQHMTCAYQRILEIAIPNTVLALRAGMPFHLAVSLHSLAALGTSQDTQVLERYPAHGAFRLSVPAPDADARVWSV